MRNYLIFYYIMNFLVLAVLSISCLAFQPPLKATAWGDYFNFTIGLGNKICEDFDADKCVECIEGLNPTIHHIMNLVNILKNGSKVAEKIFIWFTMEMPLIVGEGKICYSASDIYYAVYNYTLQVKEEKSLYIAKVIQGLIEEVLTLPSVIKQITKDIINKQYENLGEDIAEIFLTIFHPEI